MKNHIVFCNYCSYFYLLNIKYKINIKLTLKAIYFYFYLLNIKYKINIKLTLKAIYF